MISYVLNLFSRSTILISGLSGILYQGINKIKNYEILILKFKKTIEQVKNKQLKVSKENKILLSNEKNKRKGNNFFILWGRYIIIRKLSCIIKAYQDATCTHPEKALLPFTKINNQNKIDKKSFLPYSRMESSCLIQYIYNKAS